MLFNSQIFIFMFLPIVFATFFLLNKLKAPKFVKPFLIVSSVFFYGWWKIEGLLILATSLLLNFYLGKLVIKTKKNQLLILGIIFNLVFLFYFKYFNFFLDSLNYFFGTHQKITNILLPLGISFFTFQKIAFLVDAYQGKVKEISFLNYAFFVTFFPQLIAGPIVHHSDIIPQLKSESLAKISYQNIGMGLTLFCIGLFKKVLIADYASRISNDLFKSNAIHDLDPGVALFGVFGYFFQIYFDFSGYSDMALGLAQMFNVKLPVNFNSPYKSVSIVDFWRRWHMSLSRFLRDYLYIPLGGNRKGKFRHYLNLFLTMFIGGIWHGANWTFVVWGALHGVFLTINHYFSKSFESCLSGCLLWRFISFSITTTCVMFSWVFFRSDSLHDAFCVLERLTHFRISSFSNVSTNSKIFMVGCFLVVWFFPNTMEIFSWIKSQHSRFRFTFNYVWAVCVALVLLLVVFSLNQPSDFIYFQF